MAKFKLAVAPRKVATSAKILNIGKLATPPQIATKRKVYLPKVRVTAHIKRLK